MKKCENVFAEKDELPFISVLIVVRNEQHYIKNCLRSILEQRYPSNSFEVIIVDGESSDKTVDFAKETADKYSIRSDGTVSVKYLTNTKRKLASGWNLGIKESKGQYVTRLDAHACASKNFLEESVKTIEAISEAVCVGGRAESFAKTKKGRIISKVISSPFGVGNSKFRYSSKAGFVDTVGHGMYRKEIFQKVGYFNEQLKRNQDNDMHNRIRKYGGKFYYNPKIHSIYFNRETYSGLFKQGYENGKWGFYMIRNGNNAMSLRHLIPFAFITELGFCTILGFINKFFWKIGIATVVVHFFMGTFFAVKQTKIVNEWICMPFIFFLYHCVYGIGSLVGLTRKGEK